MIDTKPTLAEWQEAKDLYALGVDWRHMPIRDFGISVGKTLESWCDLSRYLQEVLAGSGRILVRCFGGCGRSGMVVLLILCELGCPPEDALSRLREVQPPV